MGKKDEIEEFTRKLQEQIMEETRRNYSPAVIDHWQKPRNFRPLEDPDGHAHVQGICGDTMEMFVRVKEETIIECGFQTDGCGTTVVCGSVATELAVGKSLIEALGAVSAAEILEILGGLRRFRSLGILSMGFAGCRIAFVLRFLKNASWKKGLQEDIKRRLRCHQYPNV